ncbi:MAG TPA: hypothetical protein VKS21_10705, partial [Spirochaetota bacterium]|nr:hypothetical protein [Spirochaetota bacterium]
MSKKNFSIILIIVLQLLAAGEKYIGINFLFGGRYDNLRMCVGSPAGVKGGPIADIGLDIKVSLDNQHDLVINLPIMRPILFGAAFKMLQYEPSVSL